MIEASGPGAHEVEADRVAMATYREATTGVEGHLPSAEESSAAGLALGQPRPGFEVREHTHPGRAHR